MRLTIERKRILVHAENDLEEEWLDKCITKQCRAELVYDDYHNPMYVAISPAPASESEGRREG